MHVHPDLRALRADDTPQRAAQAELAAAAQRWRADARVAEVLADVDAFATCRPLAECAALSALFDETAPDARDLAASFVRAATAVLAAQPLGHVVERHFTDGTLSLLQLARAGNVSLALVALDGAGLAARPEPRSVDFGPNEMWEHVIVGAPSRSIPARCSAAMPIASRCWSAASMAAWYRCGSSAAAPPPA